MKFSTATFTAGLLALAGAKDTGLGKSTATVQTFAHTNCSSPLEKIDLAYAGAAGGSCTTASPNPKEDGYPKVFKSFKVVAAGGKNLASRNVAVYDTLHCDPTYLQIESRRLSDGLHECNSIPRGSLNYGEAASLRLEYQYYPVPY